LRKIKILEIIPSCQRGGVPTVVHNLISRLDKAKFEIHLAAPNDGLYYDRFSSTCAVHDVSIRGYYPSSIYMIRKLVKTYDIDIVHGHGKGAGLYGRLATLGMGVKRAYTLHGFNCDHYIPLFRCLYLTVEKLLSRVTHMTVAVSDGEKKQAEKAGILPKGRATVIPNGIVLNKARSGEKGFALGTLSRICRAKGLEYLIEAVVLLRDRYPELMCYVAGGMPKGEEDYEAELKAMIRDRALDDKIIFLGEIGDIDSFFHKIDVYVSTSRWEGLPTAVLESFAARVPVVATDVVGNRDLVKNLKTGILVKAEDGETIAAGIEYAFEHPDELSAFTANAFRDVCENYSVNNMVSRHELLYESLLTS